MKKSKALRSFFALLISCSFVWSQDVAKLLQQEGALEDQKSLIAARHNAKTGPMKKLGASLIQLHERFQAHRGTASAFQAADPSLIVNDGYVLVDAAAQGSAAGLLESMKRMGGKGLGVFGRMVSGWMPVGALGNMAKSTSLRTARASYYVTNAGSVTSRGDVSLKSDLVRTNLGLDGSGVTIGVLSDSYDCLGGAAADIASGDLPAGGVVALDDTFCPATDEGRAMLQIVHDVAPGADLAFHSASGGIANFANGIVELATVGGSDVIVDDVIYLAEPFFQDGQVAQAVDQVADLGVAYFSSAGNDGRQGYQSEFRDSGVPGLLGGARHDFDPDPATVDDLQTFTLGTGGSIFILQWADPFFSVSGGAGAQTDLDVFVYLTDGTFTGLASASFNVGGDPVEIIGLTNSGPPIQLAFGIELAEGPAPVLLRHIIFNNFGSTFDEFPTNTGVLYGHANAKGAVAVGGSVWYNTPEWNTFVTSAFPNTGSAAGPTPILFDTAGNPTFRFRFKPEVVGPDGVNTTFFGSDLPFAIPGTSEPDGIPNFFGTSASAPHVAAVAAQILEAAPSLGPRNVERLLKFTADDMDDADTPDFDTGFDFKTGFGFVNALDAARIAVFLGFIFSGEDGGEESSGGLNQLPPNEEQLEIPKEYQPFINRGKGEEAGSEG